MKALDRRSLLAATALVLGGAHPLRAATVLTPEQSEGPYYPRPEDLLADQDADLVRIAGAAKRAGGQILHLTGTVTGRDGAPLGGSVVEIWQCDVNGRYIHGGDWSLFRERDESFQGYGKITTGTDGRYAFRTIKPVPYPGRPPHIHLKARDPRDGSVVTTQIYLADDERNAGDNSFGKLSAAEQRAMSIDLIERADGELDSELGIVL